MTAAVDPILGSHGSEISRCLYAIYTRIWHATLTSHTINGPNFWNHWMSLLANIIAIVVQNYCTKHSREHPRYYDTLGECHRINRLAYYPLDFQYNKGPFGDWKICQCQIIWCPFNQEVLCLSFSQWQTGDCDQNCWRWRTKMKRPRRGRRENQRQLTRQGHKY